MGSVPSSRHRSLSGEPFKCLNKETGKTPPLADLLLCHPPQLFWICCESLVSLTHPMASLWFLSYSLSLTSRKRKVQGMLEYTATLLCLLVHFGSSLFWLEGHSYKHFHSTTLSRCIPQESETVTWKQGTFCFINTAGVEVCSFLLVAFLLYTDSCSFVLF